VLFGVTQVAVPTGGGRRSVEVGGVAVLGAYHATIWPSGGGVGGVEPWIDLNPFGANGSLALCVTPDGLGGSGTHQVGFATFGLIDHAGMWSGGSLTWIDLHPSGPNWPNLTHSHAVACDRDQQVGYSTVGAWHATLWSGAAGTAVDLHPPGAMRSECAGVSEGVQVGNAIFNGVKHAVLWRGTAGSMVDLHPSFSLASASVATSISGPWQAGDVTIVGVHHASVWNGSAATWEDISLALGAGWSGSYARGIWRDGPTLLVAGVATSTQTGREVAMLWRKTVCCPADFDCSGGPASVPDIFGFLIAWFAGEQRADFNGMNGVEVRDIFDFLAAWFGGCG
jgi:hypothetical protein